MTVAETVHQKVLSLPPDKQAEVLEFVEVLEFGERGDEDPQHTEPRFNPEGMLAGHGWDLTFEEFEQNRKEMWGTSTDRELDPEDQ